MNGQEYTVPLTDLSEADQHYTRVWLADQQEGLEPELVLGGMPVAPGTVNQFTVPLSAEQIRACEDADVENILGARVGITVPDGFNPAGHYPILVVSATSGSRGSSLEQLKLYAGVAKRLGWVMLAAEPSNQLLDPVKELTAADVLDCARSRLE